MATFTVPKGSSVSMIDVATLQFGSDCVNMYDVNPRYLDVYVALVDHLEFIVYPLWFGFTQAIQSSKWWQHGRKMVAAMV